jgi:hypothetical protein
MSDPLSQLATLHTLLAQGLKSTTELRQAASICRSLIVSDMDGAATFLLFALYFENLARLREGTVVDVEKYENGISQLIRSILECLQAIESYDAVGLHANLDSFARTSERLQLP